MMGITRCFRVGGLLVLFILVLTLFPGNQANMEDEYDPAKDPWASDTLPEVDLEGLVYNLSQEISWFKYVGNVTLECAARSREQDTLMLAIEILHECLEENYQKCASNYADQPPNRCKEYEYNGMKPCGHLRLGHKTTPHYDTLLSCRWYLKVPDNFLMNLTVDQFYLEYSGEECLWDYVMIYDGHTMEGVRKWGRLCGRLPRFSLYGTTDSMMLTADTDYAVGKYGFRAVYQVMEAGRGETLGEPTYFDSPSGSFSLDDASPVYFEVYDFTFYYYKWFIRTDWSHIISVEVLFTPDNLTVLSVHEGTSENNAPFINLTNVVNKTGESQIRDEVFNSHQILVFLRRSDRMDNTTFIATYSTSPKTVDMPSFAQYNTYTTSKVCQNGGMEWTHPGNSSIYSIDIATSFAIEQGVSIQCHLIFTAPPGMFIQLRIQTLEFKGPNIRDCMNEGLLVVDGPELAGVNHTRYGPYCYDEPQGLFTNVGNKNGIVSTGQQMVLMYYSYVDFEAPFVPEERGRFKAFISITHCQGFFQPCSRGEDYDIATEHYRAIGKTDLDTDHRHVSFTCDKDHCCNFQELPVYGVLTPGDCSITGGVHGPQILATSDFKVGLVTPRKNDTYLQYGCERLDNLTDVQKGGRHDICRGTTVHLRYGSTSQWSHGALNFHVEPSKCGFYLPNVHYKNELYPPCAEARFPSIPGTYNVTFIDPNYNIKKYYTFLFDYRQPNRCPYKELNDTIEIKSSPVSFVWSRMPKRPLQWRSWPTTMLGQNWSREVIVTRHNEAGKECDLVLIFQDHEMKRSINDTVQYQCKDGFENIGDQCISITWPGRIDEKPQQLLGLYLNMSSHEAEANCKKKDPKGHLLILKNKGQHERLDLQIFYKWWSKYLKYIPGIKVFHIGLRTADIDGKIVPGKWRWSNFKPATYAYWWTPDYTRRNPDETWHHSNGGSYIPSIRSQELREALGQMQPNYNADDVDMCVVFVLTNPHKRSKMVKIPCDLQIPGSIGLCESEPLNKSIDIVPSPSIRFLTTLSIHSFKGSHRKHLYLRPATEECPFPYILVGQKCIGVAVNRNINGETVPLNMDTLSTSCPALGSMKYPTTSGKTCAKIRLDETSEKGTRKYTACAPRKPYPFALNIDELEEQTPVLIDLLRTVKHDPLYDGDVRFHVKSSEVINKCQLIRHKVVTDEDGTNSRFDYYIEKTKPPGCVNKKGVYTFLCQVDPVSTEERCLSSQFQCGDDSCIVGHHKCDGQSDCVDGTDEMNCASSEDQPVCQYKDNIKVQKDIPTLECTTQCYKENCTCNQLYFQCESGGCIPISKICDYQRDCTYDGSDEMNCQFPKCKESAFKCVTTGQCITMDKKCNGFRDCTDGTDESDCSKVCLTDYTRCQSVANHTGHCIPLLHTDDMIADCPLGTDEKGFFGLFKGLPMNAETGEVALQRSNSLCPKSPDSHTTDTRYELFPCDVYFSSHHNCMSRGLICVYDVDSSDVIKGCRRGDHLRNCENFQCSGMFKCPNSYCLPLSRVCDGVPDCPLREDEINCDANFHCPGMFKCRNEQRCIRQRDVCNGRVDCPQSGDDEELCYFNKYPCPSDCECFGYAVSCVNKSLTAIPSALYASTRALILRHNSIPELNVKEIKEGGTTKKMSLKCKMMYRLDLSHNEITTMSGNYFGECKSMKELMLDNNLLENLEKYAFKGLINLQYLTLNGNKLTTLVDGNFDGLDSLPLLDVSHQKISTIHDYAFQGLKSILMINISHNTINKVANSTFAVRKEEGKWILLETLKMVDLSGNSILDAEWNAFRNLPEGASLRTDKHKYCCMAPQLKGKCFPPADEFSSCDNLLDSITLRSAVWALGMLAALGNIVVLHSRLKHEKETVPSILVQHLAVADLFMGVYLIIIGGADSYYRKDYMMQTDTWRNHALCKLAGFLYTLGTMMSTFLLFLLTWDRMYAVIPWCGARGMGMRGTRGFIALGWTTSAIMSALPILEFNFFGSQKFTRTGACMLINVVKGRMVKGWEFTLGIFIITNFFCFTFMSVGYFFAYKAVRAGIDIWSATFPEEMPEEEKEAELEFRKNEIIITRRLVLVVATNCLVWFPIVFAGALTTMGISIGKATTAWFSICLLPLNSALNPYLYTFSTPPYHRRKDDLLANWQEETEVEEDEEDVDEGKEDNGESSIGRTTLTKTETYQDALIREMM